MDKVEHSVQTLMSVISMPAVKAVLGPVEIHAAVEAVKVLAESATDNASSEESQQ